jgi:Nif-specific regulatory protein
MKPRLLAISGPLEGTTFALTGDEVSIGRDASSTICIRDRSVSRRHCLLRGEPAGVRLVDLDSFNGTSVNGLPVSERLLEHGDQLTLGNFQFLFLIEDSDVAPTREPAHFDDELVARSTTRLERADVLYFMPGAGFKPPPPSARAAHDLSVLLKISTTLNTLRDLQSLLRHLVEVTLEAVPAERGAILLVGDGFDEITTAFGMHRNSGVELPVRVSRTVAEQSLREGVALLCNDVADNRAYADAKSLLDSRVRSLLCVPLLTGGRPAGLFYLDTSNPAAPFDEDHLQLLSAVGGVASVALENVRLVEGLKGENQRLRREAGIEHRMIGESARMLEVYRFIEKVAAAETTVLIRGQSGTGKELAAHALHANSGRAAKPFVAVNCAVLSEALLESELFGHEKGAFTGAVAQRRGKFELAEGGTLFLDEVGELSPVTQAKLLRVLQERKFERVGGTRLLSADVRIIAATNRDLEAAIKSGEFRHDLYYRLNVVSLTMPPLRERREDIPPLARYFVAKYSKKCKRSVRGISPEARARLLAYDWPGNIRELENAVERAVILGNTDLITPEDLPEAILETVSEAAPAPATLNYHEAVNEMKKQIIFKAIEQADGNYTEAAHLLGLHPANLHRLIRTMNLRGSLNK